MARQFLKVGTKNPIASLHKAKERISKSQAGFFFPIILNYVSEDSLRMF